MENYRPRNEALLKVIAEEPAYVVIEDGGRHYRARRSPVAKACKHLPYIQDILLVKNVNPGRGIVTERVTEGRADGCTYILSESQVLRPRV